MQGRDGFAGRRVVTHRGFALRTAGITLVAVAIVFWLLESLQHRQTASSDFLIAAYSDVPDAVAIPQLSLVDGGRHIRVRLLASTAARIEIVTAAPALCSGGTPFSGDASNPYRRVDVVLAPQTPALLTCTPTRPPRSITFTRRELVVAMVFPAHLRGLVDPSFGPLHQLELDVSDRDADAAEFSGGLTQPVIPDGALFGTDTAPQERRYLSRYGAAFAPSSALVWTDYWAEVWWAAGLVVIAALLVVFGQAAFAALLPARTSESG